MNRLNQHWGPEPSDNLLDSAINALTAEPIDMEAVDRVAKRAMQLDTARPPAIATLESRAVIRSDNDQSLSRKRSWLGLAGLAASISVALFGSIWMLSSNSPVAFAHVVEQIQKAVAVRFATQVQFGASEPVHGHMLVKDDLMRIEQFDGKLVQIVNTSTKQALVLDMASKKSQAIEFDAKFAEAMANPVAQLLDAKTKSVRSMGRERIEGRKVDVFRIGDLNLFGMSNIAEMTLWVDAETQLPAKIVIRDTDPKHKLTMAFDHFDWNPDVGASLLSLKPPSGFAEDVVLSKPGQAVATPKPSVDLNFNAGVLSNSRVPGWIEVDRKSGRVTAILRDAESTPVQQYRPHELRQWELASGAILWSEPVGGANSFAQSVSKGWLALVEGQEIQIRELSTGKTAVHWESSRTLGCVALDTDCKWLAHGYSDWGTKNRKPNGGIELWNIETKSIARTFEHGSPIEMVQFSPDGMRLVSASGSGSVKVWNIATGELEKNFDGQTRAAFSNDGKLLATISNEPSNDPSSGRVDIYNLENQQIVRSLVTQSGIGKSFLLSLCFAPDDQRLAATDWNGAITAWDLTTGKSFAKQAPEKGGVHSVRFINDDEIVTGSEDGILRVRKIEASK